VFIDVGQLYINFLNQQSITHKKVVASVADNHGVESTIPIQASNININPEDVIAWLITQPNANGSLYLENVVRQYMGALRSVPARLEISNRIAKNKGVFSCNTSEELIKYWDLLKGAPNYKLVNNNNSGMFSAGMNCYLRYLKHLESEYSKKSAPVVSTKETEEKNLVNDNTNTTITSIKSTIIDDDTSSAINIVLANNFTNGFRYSNGIELSRLKRLVKEQLGKDVKLNDDEIVKYVRTQGTEYEGKIYVVSKETKENIYRLVDEYFQQGASAIFYAEFFAKHEIWLLESSIVSEEMLNEIFRENYKSFYFTQTYFGQTSASIYNVLKCEILRVWGSDVLLSYEVLAERLEYIPMSRIEYHLGQNKEFIWNTKGEFTHISKIDITEYEKKEIANYIETEIRTHGYASISDVPLGEIIDRNYMLSITAIHNAVYFICLSKKYNKNGKIIIRKGVNIDALDITKEYCKTLDRCTLDDLLDFVSDLTGERNRWIAIQAGYDVLVRTDENIFIAERHIHFDIAAIDMVIEYFMHGGEYTPIQSVTTFAMLPHCGQAWNLFILESYCRRFSEDFRFECLSANSKNSGVIIRKKSRLSYLDIMSDAIAKSDVKLNKQSVLDFLVENGYISARRFTKVTDLINHAETIRNK
ncbi:MAG: hypothetical protein PHI32_13410, partial [Dysgonamonadaceae bacterium]|nr:hypothetical protein [Dysgonamonadaceae bacterium]